MIPPIYILMAVLLATIAGLLVIILLRPRLDSARLIEALATNFQKGLADLGEKVGELTGLVSSTIQAQASLVQSLAQVQDSLQTNLATAQTNLRQEITQTREIIAQMKSAEEVRERIQREASEVLKRLEAIIAGTKSRGAAGENILSEALSLLPPQLRETNVRINNRVVEFAINLPRGKVLPIDSKWPALPVLEQLQGTEDPAQRKRLQEAIEREVNKKVEEAVRYLDPEKTIMLGIVAVPDAVYELCTRAHVEAYKKGIIIIGYTQAVPYILSLLQIILRFSSEVDTTRLSATLKVITDSLERMDKELEGRFAGALTQLKNSREELASQLARARQASASLYLEAEPEAKALHPIGLEERAE